MRLTIESTFTKQFVSLCFAAALSSCAVEETTPDIGGAGSGENNGGNSNVDVTTPVACSADNARMQEVTLALINEARSEARMCGNESFAATTAVSWNNKLQATAAGHSADMASTNLFSHTGSNGSTIGVRATAQNYNWQNIGENIAAGQTSAQIAVQGWIDSPGHCANLMSPNFTETAVACVSDSNSDYNHYWTNVLGRQQ